jgi:hypothetical protein
MGMNLKKALIAHGPRRKDTDLKDVHGKKEKSEKADDFFVKICVEFVWNKKKDQWFL